MAASAQRRQPSRKAKLSIAIADDNGPTVKSERSASPRLVASTELPIERPASPNLYNQPETHIVKAASSSYPILGNQPLVPLRDKKLLSYTKYNHGSPFPSFPRPTHAEIKTVVSILTSLHGTRSRPAPSEMVAPTSRAGCGDSPSVLDALVRTILSQNTSDANSSRAKRSMDDVYGSSDRWDAIVEGGQKTLENTIRCGGLGAVKSRVILQVLEQVKERYGEYSLEVLRQLGNDEVMSEFLSFKGVGPKTASCVMLFSLGRESFAVDTHVWRIAGLLGWRPRGASRDETHLHLDARVPDKDKYALHRLMVTHGKICRECRANGAARGNCPLRKAFRKEGVKEMQDVPNLR